MAKTSEDHQSNSRLGALGESLVQSFLLEYADWCYLCQEKHPADLLVEFGNDILAFVFFSEDHRRIIFKPNASSQTYFTFDSKIITPTLEIDSLKETLGVLSSVPVINSLFE